MTDVRSAVLVDDAVAGEYVGAGREAGLALFLVSVRVPSSSDPVVWIMPQGNDLRRVGEVLLPHIHRYG